MLTFLEGLFALWSLPFFILLLLDFIVITALVEHEEGVWATIVAVGSIVGLNYLWKLPILATVKLHPLYTAGLVGTYFALGIGWSFAKWVLFLKKNTLKYDDLKAKFLTDNNAKELTPALAAEFIDTTIAEHNRYLNSEDKVISGIPQFRDHKGTLTRWATYWPFSMVGFALNDVVRKSWTFIVNLLQNAYQRVSNHIFRNVAADVEMAKNYKAAQAAAGAEGGSSRRRGN